MVYNDSFEPSTLRMHLAMTIHSCSNSKNDQNPVDKSSNIKVNKKIIYRVDCTNPLSVEHKILS